MFPHHKAGKLGIRSDKELQKTIRYVEANPVKAGLARSEEEWHWSSALMKEIAEAQTTTSSAPPNAAGMSKGRFIPNAELGPDRPGQREKLG